MSLNRRRFIQQAIAGVGILVAPSILVPEKRFWQLDGTMWTPETAYASPDWRIQPTTYSFQRFPESGAASQYLMTIYRYQGRDLSSPVYALVKSVGDDTTQTEQRLAFQDCEQIIRSKGEYAFR